MSLTDVLCKKALPKEKQYRLSDSNGLSLRIDPNGKKYWSLRYTENGQRKSKAIGIYPELSLKRAREIALDHPWFQISIQYVVNESNLFNPDAIERQLAHVPQNRIRSAYNRAQYWDERVKIMEWYGERVKEWSN